MSFQKFRGTSPVITVMIAAVEKAARDMRRDFGELEHLQVSKKGPRDFVSKADKRSESTLISELKYARPGYSFITEESGKIEGEDKDHTWIIDPLDGTNNFLHGVPHFCISVALKTGNEITAGVIYDPIKDEMYWAEKGCGAFVDQKRMRVSGRVDMEQALLGISAHTAHQPGSEHHAEEIKKISSLVSGHRCMGAAALDLAYLAAGKLDIFYGRSLKIWDVAAGLLLIKESGGKIEGLDGMNPFAGNFVASNIALFSDLKKAIAA